MQSRRIPNKVQEPIITVIENKREKFRKLANQRAKPLIQRMRMLARLGSSAYDPSPEMIEKLLDVLDTEYSEMKTKLRARTNAKNEITDIL
jgi:hypothetical protein